MLWRKALTYWRSLAVAFAIAYACLLREPSYRLPQIEHGDKWAHWLAFMVLTLVVLWDSKKANLQSWEMWLLAIVFPAFYGGFIELLQERYFYPRTGDWADWLADCIGILIGIAVWVIGQKWHERRVDK
ncbi:MAG: VanZ family protein [Paludibacteraceae bacterium]|nr:VanZ family protein [Paludibacteraceae bacterium]